MDRVISWQERLLLWRRRCGYTQKRAAKFFEMHPVTYHLLEKGEGEKPELVEQVLKSSKGLPKNLWDAKPHEQLLIIRRRRNLTQAEFAAELGVSRYTVHLREIGLR